MPCNYAGNKGLQIWGFIVIYFWRVLAFYNQYFIAYMSLQYTQVFAHVQRMWTCKDEGNMWGERENCLANRANSGISSTVDAFYKHHIIFSTQKLFYCVEDIDLK